MRVYLDNHATTPLDRRVLDAMLPYFGPKFGNAASRSHSFGWEADQAVQSARQQVAALLGASPREIVFTSGATESNNLALRGVKGDHIVTVGSEHQSVLDPLEGRNATVVAPQADGRVDPAAIAAAIRPETVLVSVMWANNETGTIQPVREIGELCRRRGVLFHSDAVQAFGKLPVDVLRAGVDLLSVSAHKIYGPKGAGALYVRRGVTLTPQMLGGGHEFDMRSGTLNVPAIVGFGEACVICAREMCAETARIAELRDAMRARLHAELDGVEENGSVEHRLASTLNVSFTGVDHDDLLNGLQDVALSTGSACSSAIVHPSHVLIAMGFSEERIRSAVRIGVGRFNTSAEIDYATARLIEEVGLRRAI